MTRSDKRRRKRPAVKPQHNGYFTHTEAQEKTLDDALEHHQAGRLNEAERLYRGLLSTNPNHPMALHYLGLLAHQVGQYEPSIELISKAIAVMPDYVEAHCNLANTLVQLEQAEEAEESCLAAIALDPKAVSAHNHLAKALRMQGRLDDALESCQKALALNPDLADAHETMGTVYSEQGRLEEAVESYLKAISLNPNSASYHNNFGSALYMLGQYDKAVTHYQNAISLQPDYVMAHQNLANALRDAGRIDETIACLKTVLELKPDLTSAQHNLNALLGETTDNAPREYVEELFDQYANRFEDDLQNKLEYQIPSLLKKLLVDAGLAEGKYQKVVDLGCGTGLAGIEFRDIAETLTGIDLSAKMIRNAEKKGVYDQLLVDDLIQGMERVGSKVDLFISTDVFVYIGNLQDAFEAIKNNAAADALFVFSTEHIESDDGFVLQKSSRYAHSKAYIEKLAEQFGFEVLHFQQVDLRKEKTGWIDGAMYVLKCL